MKKNRNSVKQDKFNVGLGIRAQNVLCIDDNNTNHGVVSLENAINMAKSVGLDLVQVSLKGNVPVCKILDFSKFKYEQTKKEKEAKKKQRSSNIKVKEIKFRPATGENDLKIKAKQTQEFIEDGCKVKISIVFKGRELSYKSIAQEKLELFLTMLTDVGFEADPVFLGKQMTVILIKQALEKKVVAAE